jgi:hypothetical protein
MDQREEGWSFFPDGAPAFAFHAPEFRTRFFLLRTLACTSHQLPESRLVCEERKMPYQEFRKLFEQRPEIRPTLWQRIRLGSTTKWAVAGALCVVAVLLMR